MIVPFCENPVWIVTTVNTKSISFLSINLYVFFLRAKEQYITSQIVRKEKNNVRNQINGVRFSY